MIWGERILAGLFGLLGVLWVARSLELRYWSEFAPGPGFLPFWLGLTLVGLVAIFLALSFRPFSSRHEAAAAVAPTTRRIPMIVIGLALSIAVIEWLGFALAVAGYLVFLLGMVERQKAVVTIGVAFGATAALLLIFRVWLGVPLPQGPWGV